MRKPTTDEIKAEMVKLYQAGARVADIAEKFGCSYTTVWKHLKKAGVFRRHSSARKLYERRDSAGAE